MATDSNLTWEGFLSIAGMSGLDVGEAHLTELYDYLQTLLPGLRAIDDLDLSGVDPAMLYFPDQQSLA